MNTSAKRRPPKGLFVGLATVDVSYTVEEIPRRNQKISVPAQNISVGGPSANAAATFAFLGGRAALVTAVGRHPLGAIIRGDAEQFSILLHDIARSREELPSVSSIFIHRASGERTIVSANAAVFSPIKTKFNGRWLSGVGIVQVDGHYMPLCLATARAAHERAIPVVLDSGSWKPRMLQLLRCIDIVICSADFRPPGCRSIEDVFEFLTARGIGKIAITRGGTDIRFLDSGKRGDIAVKKIRPVDTLGAGDIFHGAFCYYARQPSASFRDALAAAARVATFSSRYAGTRSWMKKFSK